LRRTTGDEPVLGAVDVTDLDAGIAALSFFDVGSDWWVELARKFRPS
jgi:hypothetical protein